MSPRLDLRAHVALALALGMLAGCGAGLPRSAPHPLLNQSLTSRLPTGLGAPGRVTVLVYWSSFCTACEKRLLEFDRLWRRERGHGLDVIGIACESDAKEARDKEHRLRLGFPSRIDVTGQEAGLLGVRQYPSVALIDRSGRLRLFQRGAEDWLTLEMAVIGLLEEQPRNER